MARKLLSLAWLVIFGGVLATESSYPPTLVTDITKLLLDNYCYPEKLEGLKAVIEAASSHTEILKVPDPDTLASILTNGMQTTVNDHRLVVSYEPNYSPAVPPKLPPLPPEQLLSIVKSSIRLEVLENNIGYLRIDHIIGEEMAEKIGPLLVENVWRKVLPTSAFIFDLRYTAAGDISGVPYIVSYFSDSEPLIHIDTVYDRPSNTTTELWSMPQLLGERYGKTKPLMVLTSENTRGAAEGVAYSLKNLGRATVVGDKTAGGSVKIEKLKVGETDFYFSVPVARSTSPITGQSWEINGVSPCVSVDAEDALDTAIKILNLRSKIPSIIQTASRLVEDNYAFAEIGEGVAEKLMGLLEKDHYSMVNSQTEFEAQLNKDLQELSGDKNLGTTANSPMIPMQNPTPEMFADLIKLSFHTDVLENNIGYLRFDMFGDFEQIAPVAKIIVDNVWNKVVHTDGLIIDLRNNVGGPTSSISGFCSYFFDEDKHILLDKLYNRQTDSTEEMWTLPRLTGERYGSWKSLLILTSDVTAGAAEEFVYIMKKLGRAMIIGETTHGGSHPPKSFRLGDGELFLSIPVIHSDTAHGPAWEGAGISPHVPVAADEALATAKGILNKHFSGQK